MDSTNTSQEQSSTETSLIFLCFSCLERLYAKLALLEPSGQGSTHEGVGRMCLMESSDTPQHSCAICMQSITRSAIPTVDSDTLPTLRGMLSPD